MFVRSPASECDFVCSPTSCDGFNGEKWKME